MKKVSPFDETEFDAPGIVFQNPPKEKQAFASSYLDLLSKLFYPAIIVGAIYSIVYGFKFFML